MSLSSFKTAAWEMAKEGLRIAFFAAVTALVGWFSNVLAGIDPNSVYYIVGTLLLRLADKFVHENKEVKANGLVPF